MTLDGFLSQLEYLPSYLGNHLLLTFTALAIGISISLPLSIFVTRVRFLQGPILGIASVIQTIPSLALLALMVPILSRIGFLPAALALILYSMLPVLRNTVAGIEGTDPNLIEAGKGLGMTQNQILFKVQLPLALPVIVAGIRTSTVWVVGIATLSTPVGATSLGNYIFSGLQTQNYNAVLMGCAAAAILAIILDLLIRLAEVGVSNRNNSTLLAAGTGLVLILAGGLYPLLPKGGGQAEGPKVVVGSKTFTEQYILSDLIASLLEDAGYSVDRIDSLGSTVVFDALVAGRIDCYVDYSGTIWTNHMKREDNPGSEKILDRMTDWLRQEHGIACLGPIGFENAYALAMRRADTEAMGITTIEDLAPHTPQLRIGGDYEFFHRPEWTNLEEEYELNFREETSLDSTLMYSAIVEEEVDVISAFSSDGRIAAYDLVVLDDPKEVLPPYDAVLLVSEETSKNATFAKALDPLLEAISTRTMRKANKMVDVDKEVSEAAGYLKNIVSN